MKLIMRIPFHSKKVNAKGGNTFLFVILGPKKRVNAEKNKDDFQ